MSDKTPSQLIEERVQEMGGMYGNDIEMPYKYNCMDTGLTFETYGESAAYSPYTGGTNIMLMEEVKEQSPADFQKTTAIPASQTNPMQQTPLQANPVPAAPAMPWQNAPWAGNPAPDQQAVIGADQASVATKGFVPYPQQSVPPHVNKNPGEKT